MIGWSGASGLSHLLAPMGKNSRPAAVGILPAEELFEVRSFHEAGVEAGDVDLSKSAVRVQKTTHQKMCHDTYRENVIVCQDSGLVTGEEGQNGQHEG